jgi:predicted  nucleic acid-binding Zn-ribbon protein
MDSGSDRLDNLVVEGDTPTHRKTVLELTHTQLMDWVRGVQTRRMFAQHEYELGRAVAEATKREKDKASLEKQTKMLEKEFVRLDKLVASIEKRVEKLRVQRMLTERLDENA